MKKKIATLLLLPLLLFSQFITPIENGKLTTDLNANNQKILNLTSVGFVNGLFFTGADLTDINTHLGNADIHMTLIEKQNAATAFGWGDHALAGYIGADALLPLGDRILTLEGSTNRWNTALQPSDITVLQSSVTANSVTGGLNTVAIGNEVQARIAGDLLNNTAITNETALRIAGDIALSNAVAGISVDEQDPRYTKWFQYDDPDKVITPTNAFTFSVSGGEATITGYSGSYADVVIPYEFYGVPVVAVGGSVFVQDDNVTSITSGRNLNRIGTWFAYDCNALTIINLPYVAYVGSSFANLCDVLTTITIPQLATVNKSFAEQCISLSNISIPSATSILAGAFKNCIYLTSVYYFGDIPIALENNGIYDGTPTNLISYVTNPQAKNWGSTFCNRPVVFPNGRFDDLTVKSLTIDGVTKDAWPNIDLTTYMPYTGADRDANLGEYKIVAKTITAYKYSGVGGSSSTTLRSSGIDFTAAGINNKYNLPRMSAGQSYTGFLITEEGVDDKIAEIKNLDLDTVYIKDNFYVHDSGTNLVWKNVYSNGWHWLIAYTNTSAGGQ